MEVASPNELSTGRSYLPLRVGQTLITGSVCAAVVCVDLATKAWAFQWLGGPGERPVWWVWEGVFGFQTTLNEGAVFGLGQGWTQLFTIIGVAALLILAAWYIWLAPKNDTWVAIAVGAILGGILGNLYDRLGLHGLRWQESWIGGQFHSPGDPVYAVRDFILVMIGPYPWPNFNLADSALVCAVSGLILRLWILESKQVERPLECIGKAESS